MRAVPVIAMQPFWQMRKAYAQALVDALKAGRLEVFSANETSFTGFQGDAAVLDVIFGRFTPSGKLPFELPSSMEAVQQQKEDLPYDSVNPLYPFGFGLTY